LRFALLLCFSAGSLTACPAQNKGTAATAQQKIAALQGLRDSGVISQDEYEAKVAALTTPTRGAAAADGGKSAAWKKLGEPTVAHTLNDQAWGLPWGTIKLPAGWGFNGGVVHGNNCMISGDNPMWSAESPDKTAGIAFLPILRASYYSNPQILAQMRQAGCPILRSTRAADFLTQIVLPHLHKNFKVVGTAPEMAFVKLADKLRAMDAQNASLMINNKSMQNRNTVDTARVVLTYDEGGTTRVELASAELSCHEMRTAGIGRMPGNDSLDCVSFQTVIVHAPDDGTPLASLATMDVSKSMAKPFFSITPNPAWQNREQNVLKQQGDAIVAQGQANLQTTQNNINRPQNAGGGGHDPNESVADYSRRVHNKVYQDQQKANDQVTGAVVAHMGDYNVYTNNSTGQQYQLSNQYTNSYVNQNGSATLQTNSANSPGVDWTELTPKY
jgi:hypothetical protein